MADPETLPGGSSIFTLDNITSQRPVGEGDLKSFDWQGRSFKPGKGTFKTDGNGLKRLARADRLGRRGTSLRYVRHLTDFSVVPFGNLWTDTVIAGSRSGEKTYIVQTAPDVIQRCILMTTDPGDLVLDPTCGSGTSAYVAEQWGRRWMTMDTSRVTLALARTRLMAARYPWYLLADSREGRAKEAALTQTVPPEAPVHDDKVWPLLKSSIP